MHYLIGAIHGVITPMGEAASIADLLTVATSLFSWIFTSLGTVVTTVTSNGILLLGVLISLCGLVIGVFKRLVNVM